MLECPQCGTTNESEAKNCRQCRVNLYWAFQHYEELAAIRQSSQMAPAPASPAFLVQTSQKVDTGPTASWLSHVIKKFGMREAGKKVSTT